MKRNKFNAVKVELDGHTFDSKKEAAYYQELKLREKAKEVSHIEVHPKIEVIGHKSLKKLFSYTPDFRFFDKVMGKRRVIDVKGYKKGSSYQIFRLKKKLVEEYFPGTEVEEI